MPSRHTQSARPNSRCSHAPECVPAAWLAAIALVVSAACDTPGVTLIDPDVASGPDTVTFHVQLEDSDLAQVLGWDLGVPGAEIQLHRIVDPFQPHVLNTDSAGNAYISNLLPGLYKVAGYRLLSNDETGPTGGVTRAFGDGFELELGGTGRVSLALASDRRGSLLISEVYDGGGTGALGDYHWATFSELYNNADTTVYLDGMLLGYSFGVSYSGRLTCEENQPFREDPEGLWSLEFHQFPGGGRDFPVAPGQVVTIAMDAVDHSQVDPAFPDLSDADFELGGSGDPDNPDVPNLPAMGPMTHPYGHGMWLLPTKVIFLALPADVATLETRVHSLGRSYVRIPTELVLDVTHGRGESPASAPPYIVDYYCLNWVNREFDRLESVVYRPDDDKRTSVQRKVLAADAGNRILQDINASRVDFSLGPYNPGSIEWPVARRNR
ncbi:MAG: hypothetical protein JSW51_01690 [Gemmatimonadota bacterium]|nr:MAG: hypothetical protein JSW51_01690 [Gemmatimonadota bacterium]